MRSIPTEATTKDKPSKVGEIPNLFRWAVYSVFMFIITFLLCMPWLQHIGLSLILGHFSAQLNALIYKN